VVRDYGLKVAIYNYEQQKNPLFTKTEILEIKKRVLEDARNTRKNRQLWIVERAQNFNP
jgi:hypothetical protein